MENEMLTISFNMTHTLFLAILLLLLGNAIVNRVSFISKYCIPGAVVGSLLFSIVTLILRQTGVLAFSFDVTLQQFFMNLFFTASGFAANMSLLKRGGKLLLIFLGLAALLSFLQNALAVFMSGIVGVEPMIGLMAGSIPLTGGHGSAASFAPLAEEMGYVGANAVAVAAATFGLVAGSVLGGPLANRLITKRNLLAGDSSATEEVQYIQEEKQSHIFSPKILTKAFYLIIIGLGLGSIFHILLKQLLPNVTFPIHAMGMLGGVITRIVMDSRKIEVPEEEIDALGSIFLGIFVSMAICTMRLWELIDLAIPIIVILALQIVLAVVYVRFLTFNLMGRDYDAAVISAGHVGFGMGAVPVAMANMNSVCGKFKYSKLAFFVVPIIGGLFADFTNVAIITLFMNIFG